MSHGTKRCSSVVCGLFLCPFYSLIGGRPHCILKSTFGLHKNQQVFDSVYITFVIMIIRFSI